MGTPPLPWEAWSNDYLGAKYLGPILPQVTLEPNPVPSQLGCFNRLKRKAPTLSSLPQPPRAKKAVATGYLKEWKACARRPRTRSSPSSTMRAVCSLWSGAAGSGGTPALLCGFAGGFALGPLQPACRKATLSSGDTFFLMPPFLWSRDCSVSALQGVKGSSAATGRSRSMPLSVESTEKRVCLQHSQSEMMSWISKLSRSWLRQSGSQLCDSGRTNSTSSFPAGRRELEEGNTTKARLSRGCVLAPLFSCKA